MKPMKLPLTGRIISPDVPPFLYAEEFLQEVAQRNLATSRAVQTALRLFADWLQHEGKAIYSMHLSWPLDPAGITEPIILEFRRWLAQHRSSGTAGTYMSNLVRYFTHLEAFDLLPDGVSLGRLKRQLKKGRQRNTASRVVVNKHEVIQHVPQLATWFEEIPVGDKRYGRDIAVKRNNALIQVFMSTGARVHEVAGLNRAQLDAGQTRIMIIGKNDKARTIHFDEKAREAIDQYLAMRGDSDPALFIMHARRTKPGSRLSISAIQKIVRDASRAMNQISLRDRAIVSMLRQTEITALQMEKMTVDDVDTLELPAYVAEAVEAWLKAVPPKSGGRALFMVCSGGLWGHGKGLSALAMAEMGQAGVMPAVFPDSITPHHFRHYRATQLLRAGVPLEVVQEYLGHADPSTTRTVYAPVLGAGIVGNWLDKIGR